MKSNIIRILHIVTYMGRGGLETMIMNYYRNIDRNRVQFDFLVHRDFEADYDEEIKELGGKIYRLPPLNPLSKEYLSKLDSFFKEHKEYKIVHSHIDCMSAIPLKYAKLNGVPVRIAHAHSSNQTKDLKYPLKLFYKTKISKYANNLFACSNDAGRWMFGKSADFTVLNNAIDTEKYLFNNNTAQKVRKELNIKNDSLVIGHVGRFENPKNHIFIIDIFAELLKNNSNSVLLLVGEGSLRKSIEEKVNSLGISNKVIFAGLRTDVNELLQAMDVFLFPSLYEGLPVSIIEAQASGLPCLISDKVPIECKKTDLVYHMNLSDSPDKWAGKVVELSKIKRKNAYEEIKESGFDIKANAEKLEEFYLNAYKGIDR